MEGQQPILLLPQRTETALQNGRTPTDKQKKAVEYLAENGGTKADAVRAAGYSETIARNPDRVFNSPYVMALLDRALGEPDRFVKKLEKLTDSKRVEHITFPPYAPEKALQYEQRTAEDGIDRTEVARGEQMTDEDIREYLEEEGIKVKRIVHGDMVRHVYAWRPDTVAQLDALDKIINLYGLYAPKKVEGNFKHKVGVFSPMDLRRKMREHGIPAIVRPK